MKAWYTHFSPNAVIRERYQRGVDYLEHEFDLGFDDTLYLLKELKPDRDSLSLQSSDHTVRFYFESDQTLWVEVDDINGLWAVSEINLDVGTAILRIAFDGGKFGEHIPTTDREWDAYSGPNF